MEATSSSQSKPTKRVVVPSACTSCQQRKSKCDGKQPSCTSCVQRGHNCQYNLDDLRRIEVLRRHNRKLSEKVSTYKELISSLLREPEENAVEFLRHLRTFPDDVDLSDLQEEIGFQYGTDQGSNSDVNSPAGGVEIDPSSPSLRSNWHPALQISARSPGESQMQWTPTDSPGSRPGKTQPPELSGTAALGRRSPGKTPWLGLERSGELYATPGHVEVFGNLSMSSAIATTAYPDSIPSQQMLNHKIPIHFIQPVVVFEDSRLSRTYTGYVNFARGRIASGAPLADFVGPQGYVNVDLYFRDWREGDPHSASSWACQMWKPFHEFDHVVKLGGIALLTYFMRWLLDPTAESYANLPDLMKPTPSQLLIPHVPAIDLLIIPELRDAAISRLRDWITPMSQFMQLQWPYGRDRCVEIDSTSGCRRLTKQFEECVKNPDNWSWSKDVLKVFPEVKGKVRIRE